MIPMPSGVRVWLAVGRTDMRRGMNGLALQVQEALGRDPHAGDSTCSEASGAIHGGHDAILEFVFRRDADVAQDGTGMFGKETLDQVEP
jgi:hypothetical protein